MASYRYRAKIPAQALIDLGHEVTINSGDVEYIIFHKYWPEDLPIAKAAKESGIKMVFDICDDHFLNEEIGNHLKAMCSLADLITVPTKQMQSRVNHYVKRDAVVIGDPYELPALSPRNEEISKVLWFGHHSNLPDFARVWPQLYGFDVRIVTTKGALPCAIQWTPERIKEELFHAHVVIIPTNKKAYYKSSNRAIESIRSGCFVIAEPHPALDEFRDFIWQGSIQEGLRWAQCFRHQLPELIEKAQAYVRTYYSPIAIGKQWEKALSIT